MIEDVNQGKEKKELMSRTWAQHAWKSAFECEQVRIIVCGLLLLRRRGMNQCSSRDILGTMPGLKRRYNATALTNKYIKKMIQVGIVKKDNKFQWETVGRYALNQDHPEISKICEQDDYPHSWDRKLCRNANGIMLKAYRDFLLRDSSPSEAI